jgi:predicted DNA-binding transcriptional regulator AlpA
LPKATKSPQHVVMKNDDNGRRRTVPKGQRVGRPELRTPMERAQRIADDLEGMREDYDRVCAIEARFSDATEQEVIAMWKAGRNEKGEPLDGFKLEALSVRWYMLFGFEPPFDVVEGDASAKADTELADDTHMPDVLRRTGISQSELYRMRVEGRFPPAEKLTGKRRIGWKEVDLKAREKKRPRKRVFRRRVR